MGTIDERLLKDRSDVVFIDTTKEQDRNISNKAFNLQNTTDQRKYRLFTNNCVDSFQDVCGAGGVDLPLDVDPRPNSYFEELKKQYPNNYTNKAYD